MKKTLLLGLVALLSLMLGVAQAQDDPFAGLGGSDDTALAVPDGSSSIRAKKKASPNMFEGRVQGVIYKEENFPKVDSIWIKITKKPGLKKAPHNELKKNKKYEFKPYFKTGKDGRCDMADENVKLNVGAWYLEKGDKVQGVIKEKKDGVYILEFVQRKSKTKK